MCVCEFVCVYVRKREKEKEGLKITANKTMKVGPISDIHIHRIYFCRQEGEIRNRILHHFSAHKHGCTRWCAERERRDGEADKGRKVR